MKLQYIKIAMMITVMLVGIMLPEVLHAQPAFDDDVNDVPIDGGLSVLLAAGAAYGVKKVRNTIQKK